ncbi:MAG: tetratricopeptide repeat protein, partial [Candidatus Hermodarchaeota archaeon]
AWIDMGELLGNINRVDEAIKAFDRAIKLDSKNARVWYDKGVALGLIDQHANAVKAYRMATTLNPNDERSFFNLANTLARNLEEYEPALEVVDTLLEINPEHTNGLYLRGRILVELNRHKEANECFNKVLTLEPDYPYLKGEKNSE